MMVRARRLGTAWLATAAAPLLWAATTQIGQILPYIDCQHEHRWTAITALAAAALALFAGGICWANRSLTHTGRFLCGISSLLALILAFAMLLQSTAGFVLTGCER